MSTGYSGTPLSRKLGIREGTEVATLGAPEELASLLEPLPAGASVRSGLGRSRSYPLLLVFATTREELARRFAAAQRRLTVDGALWACWPKLSSSLASELREADVRAHGLSAGLVDNKVCAIDADWSGLRFVVRLRDR